MCEMAEDADPAPVLQACELPLEEAKAHLRLGGSGAHNGVECLSHHIEAGEGCAKALAVLVVGQGPGHAVKKQSNCGGDILSERLDILLVTSCVPQ